MNFKKPCIIVMGLNTVLEDPLKMFHTLGQVTSANFQAKWLVKIAVGKKNAYLRHDFCMER